MQFINSDDGIKHADPESFRFNTSLMAGFRLALRFIKVPDYSGQMTGNAKILWDIFEDYKKCEGKVLAGDDLHPEHALPAQHRFDILSRGIAIAIYKYFFDSAYREVGDRILYLVIQNGHKFKFPPHHLDPDCWCKDAIGEDLKNGPGNRITPGVIIPECQVVSADDHAIVVREVLPPKKYFGSIEGMDHWVSIDSNRPQWVGTGWAYRIYAVYGTQSELETKTLLGE